MKTTNTKRPSVIVAGAGIGGIATALSLSRLGLSDAQALTLQVKLGLLPADLALDALPAGVAKDLGWLNELADGKKPFAAVTHCLCELP